MCDTVCAVTDTAVFFGKNSDREPGEAQGVEIDRPAARLSGKRRCTHVSVPEVEKKRGVILSRPAWMWGCEMGANDAGVVGGNEAVFTRVPVAPTGLTGMDLLRLALERASTAEEAVHVVTELLARHPQGGGMGFRDRSFRYSLSFLFADASGAWVLETAGPYWAAERVSGVRTLSNVLSIGAPERVHEGAVELARARGWLARGEDFHFARCFGDPVYRWLTGGEERRACTTRALVEPGGVSLQRLFALLRDHGGSHPAEGLRLMAPCAHASFWPTRHAGQTTASMLSELRRDGSRHFFTGTSSPCMSVFKPVSFEFGTSDLGPGTPIEADGTSLYFLHERLHRAVLRDHAARRPSFERERSEFEASAVAAQGPGALRDAWRAHREALPAFLAAALAVPASANHRAFQAYWTRQSRLDGLH